MKAKPISTPLPPVVFWHSDPVFGNETVVLAGADFHDDTVVELRIVGQDKGKWTAVKPLQTTPVSLKAVIPAQWKKGIYSCRARHRDGISKVVFLNEPVVWWKQGEGGVDRAETGSWLRLFGKCLDIDGGARVKLVADKGRETALTLVERGTFALSARVPENCPPGTYRVTVSNGAGGAAGWREAGTVEIYAPVADTRPLLNVLDYGADNTGLKDCTLPIVQALERAQALGGGIVYLPRGRYRVDSILRSGVWVDAPLVIPEHVTLRGEGANLTSLWWPTREKPLTSLIEGHSNFSVEDLAIYAQGTQNITIFGESNVRLQNLIVRANPYYMTLGPGGPPHHGNATPPKTIAPSISLWGDNNRILNCDILCSAVGIEIRKGYGNVISGNTIRGFGQHALHAGCQKMIYENNSYEGDILAGGCNVALHFGGSIARHVYYKGNRSQHLYAGDHECLTFDGHLGVYFGRVKNVKGTAFRLVGKVQPLEGKGTSHEMHQTAVYIIDGRGAGQWRFLTAYDATGNITIDRPWDIDPDEDSLLEIGGFNGQHLIIDNTASDGGALVQLYPTNCENYVVGNKGTRVNNLNSLGMSGCYPSVKDLTKLTRVEVSWYNQFIDNEIIAGNSWGGGTTHVDRWLGGESTLLIHGHARAFYLNAEGVRHSFFPDAEWLRNALGEKTHRDRNLAISRFQIVRRHIIRNNSSIRVRGVVSDALIEHCRIADSAKGIRVDMEVDLDFPVHLGQLFNFEPEPSEKNPKLPFLRPEAVLVRGNHFQNVAQPYAGCALELARIEE
jgi:hypothetical protein